MPAGKLASTLSIILAGAILASFPAMMAFSYYYQSKEKREGGADPGDWMVMGVGLTWVLLVALSAHALAFCSLAAHYKMYVKTYPATSTPSPALLTSS